MIIDQKTLPTHMRQFASQLQHVPPHLVADFDKMFAGDQSDEFYHGLLAGVAVCHQILSHDRSAERIPYLIAYIASLMEKKEIT